jgi:uncharacterized damage-inducible protein DinB
MNAPELIRQAFDEVHHRTQLGVYLRMNNIAVPGIYGPSQDDKDALAK